MCDQYSADSDPPDTLTITFDAGLYTVRMDGLAVTNPVLTRAAAEQLRDMLQAKTA
ncbi:MAG TPA: hypothetical protein VHT68_15700 [Pseudolabrys sp.]|jgi:hypothetical protein|nr:hypothetical protein [Pseudolabrys sp.]